MREFKLTENEVTILKNSLIMYLTFLENENIKNGDKGATLRENNVKDLFNKISGKPFKFDY